MIIRRVAQTPVTNNVQPQNEGVISTVSRSPEIKSENKASYPLKLLKGAFVAAVVTFVSFLSPEVGVAILALLMTDSKRDN